MKGVSSILALLAAAVIFQPESPARADILVLQDGSGQIHITNVGHRRGYRVVARIRETPRSFGADPAHAARYDSMIAAAAGTHSVDPALVKAVIRAESNFEPRAVSPKGAMGLMQLMPGTARIYDIDDPFDPTQNIGGGVQHLRMLLDRYDGELDLALSAYNAGAGNVDGIRRIPDFPETQEYVRRVRLFFKRYRENPPKLAKAS